MWAAQHFHFDKPNRWMTSGGLGTMGYGLPAAVGVQVAHPDALVIDIAGEASVQMTMQEMSTAVQYRLPIKIFILNNERMGMVRQWQTLFYDKRYSSTILQDKVDFVKFAESMGARGIRVSEPSAFAPALEEAIRCGEPVVIECVIDQDDKVFPMVPAGRANSEVFDARDLAQRD
jgi:acetolactate synthase-1/2/3 large subunit